MEVIDNVDFGKKDDTPKLAEVVDTINLMNSDDEYDEIVTIIRSDETGKTAMLGNVPVQDAVYLLVSSIVTIVLSNQIPNEDNT